jgi:hypothetical protein
MRKLTVFLLILLITLPVLCQAPPDKYASGSITAVARHHEEANASTNTVRYDVSVKVGKTIYVVLYTPPYGSSIVEYRVGADVPVLVGDKTLKFPDVAGKTHEVPILSKSPAPAQE